MGSIISTAEPEARPANKMLDLTCALATGSSYEYFFVSFDVDILMGSLPFDDLISAPISVKGLSTLSIGREDSDSSPQKERFNPRPEVKPSMSRKPVPELPRSRGSSQLQKIKSLFGI